ncbi:hypothetical protein ES703_56435 [subsurface metagenome]
MSHRGVSGTDHGSDIFHADLIVFGKAPDQLINIFNQELLQFSSPFFFSSHYPGGYFPTVDSLRIETGFGVNGLY